MSKSNRPIVSVIVATYNQAEFLPKCLHSLKNQTMRRDDYEIIVVNDGSTDNTEKVISDYQSILRVVTHPRQQGLSAACNSGLERSEGEFIVRVDSDDWLDDNALGNLAGAQAQNRGVDIVIPDYWVVEDGKIEVESPDIDDMFTWVAGGPLLKREAVLKAGSYRPLYWEEYDLYLRMMSDGAKAVKLDVPVLYHREHGRSLTASEQARAHGWQELINVWPMSTLQKFGFRDSLMDT